ncbi:MAG: septum formation initiator family protein [bacterium]|nr:septum formation initiator family protein [bacterium]
MSYRSHHTPQRSWFRSRIVLVIGIAVLVFVLRATYREYAQQRAADAEIRQMEDAVATLEAQRTRLTDLLEQSESPAFLEREARLRLGLRQPGEEVLIIPQGTVLEFEEATKAATSEESNLRRWWRHLFGIPAEEKAPEQQ